MKKYYEVNAKCGHVGRSNYINISFPIMANSKSEAASICRRMGRVKHHRKDAINYVIEITQQEYQELETHNELDPYLQCTNRQMQNEITGLETRVLKHELEEEKRTRCVDYKLKKQKVKTVSSIMQIKHYIYC